MNAVSSEPSHSALAQRIAKVRNCMLVEVSTGISPIDKNLFVSLCQSYDQQSVVTSSLLGESHESLPHCISSISNLTQEATQPTWPISILGRSVSLWQRGVGVLVTNQAGIGEGDDIDDFDDWDKR